MDFQAIKSYGRDLTQASTNTFTYCDTSVIIYQVVLPSGISDKVFVLGIRAGRRVRLSNGFAATTPNRCHASVGKCDWQEGSINVKRQGESCLRHMLTFCRLHFLGNGYGL